MTPVRILKTCNIRFGIIVWPTSWSFLCLPVTVLYNRFFVSTVLLHAAIIVYWFVKCLSAVGPHVFHMRLFSNALSLLSYTEAREEYPLDVGEDSARTFPFLLAFLRMSLQTSVACAGYHVIATPSFLWTVNNLSGTWGCGKCGGNSFTAVLSVVSEKVYWNFICISFGTWRLTSAVSKHL